MPRSSRAELESLRAQVWERDRGTCIWPGCDDPATELAHLAHRGMGGSRKANDPSNACAMCARHHDLLDGRTSLGTLRWELAEMLRYLIQDHR